MINYQDMFSYEHIEKNIAVLKLLLGPHKNLVSVPFFIHSKNGTRRSNSRFFKELKKFKTGLVFFFVYTEIKESMNHAIAGCINHDIKQVHLYDSNGENGSYYLQSGLTSNMNGNTFLMNSKHVYSPCSNMIYQIVFKYLKQEYSEYMTNVHMENNLNPRFCIKSSPLGMCALWAFIYIVLRSHGVSDFHAPIVISKISESAFKAENEFDIVYLISALLENRSEPRFNNIEDYAKGLDEIKNNIVKRFTERTLVAI